MDNTERADDPVAAFVASVTPEKRRRDAHRLIELMSRATHQSPHLAGTIVGFGSYHYRYATGREGNAAAAGFAPRKAATTIYLLDGIGAHTAELERLGPHRTGVGCLYITDLDLVDLAVLEEIVAASYRTLIAATYPLRAHDRDGQTH